jgi:hypothetical protein
MNYAHSVTDRFVGLVTIVSKHRQALETQFARILSEYGAAISRLAFSYEAVASVREELVQEIAPAIWQALAHFRGDCFGEDIRLPHCSQSRAYPCRQATAASSAAGGTRRVRPAG